MYTKAQSPIEIKPIVAIAHLIVMSSIIKMPTWDNAAEMTNEGIRKAAIADAATLGYESIVTISQNPEGKRNKHITRHII
jgi:hypothetical protein